ncbi:hypothetical protein [Clostridium sp. Ade.TY]|uniref:hypothetical protein n=1 Tax=Clostridium sp. Ade.TY TaxID=1391647 RepID=UPI0004096E64|nr:hypothetical protein [Clostridium sp. Ade.TY]
MNIDKKLLEYYLNNLNDKDLNILIRELKIKINGFNNIKNKNIVIPKVILINNILKTNKISELKEYFFNDSLNIRDYSKIGEEELIDLFKKGIEQKYIIEFLIISSSDDYKEIKNIINKDILENKKLRLYNDIYLEKKKEEMSDISNNLNEENIKLIKKIRILNKEKEILTKENTQFKNCIEASKKEIEKYKHDYKNLKIKYDESKKNANDIKTYNILLENEKKKLEEICDKLKYENIKLNEKIEKRIGVIGEINKKYFNNKDYKIDKITVDNVDNLNNIVNEYDEVWILLYDFSLFKQREFRNIKKNKVYKFKNFTELNNYLNRGV